MILATHLVLRLDGAKLGTVRADKKQNASAEDHFSKLLQSLGVQPEAAAAPPAVACTEPAPPHPWRLETGNTVANRIVSFLPVSFT